MKFPEGQTDITIHLTANERYHLIRALLFFDSPAERSRRETDGDDDTNVFRWSHQTKTQGRYIFTIRNEC